MNASLTSHHAWIVLNAIPHLGPVNTRRLLDAFNHDPIAVLQANSRQLCRVKGIGEKAAGSIQSWRNSISLENELESLSQSKACFISQNDSDYPSNLKTLFDAPLGLYWKGAFRFTKEQPSIAIIGSRNATVYGLKVARQFAQRLATMGFCIVSGLARGIDSAAHEGALQAGGDTVAVLGNGIDIVYPPENLELYRAIAEQGAIVSEFRFGRRADRQSFPMRNRIVSGLCEGVLVVESDSNGGSMITAKFAAEQGRQVYAIPGKIDQRSSRGCHRLIKEGAILTTSVEDILEDLKYRMYQPDLFDDQIPEMESEKPAENPSVQVDLGEENLRIMKVLKKEGALCIDEIVDVTGLSISVVNSNLMMLELKKLVKKTVDGNFQVSG